MCKPSTPFEEKYLENGFLTEFPPEELARVRSYAAEHFAFAERLNRRLMALMRELKPRRTEPTEVLGMLLFVKAINTFQGGVLLCQRGLVVESQNLARTTLECTIHLMALQKDPKHVDVMLAEYDRHRKTHADKLIEHHNSRGSMMSEEEIEVLRQHSELEGASYKMEQLARSVGMSVAYDSMYRGTSGYGAHATLGALQQLLGEQSDEEVNIIFGGDLARMRHSITNLLIPAVDLIQPLGIIFKNPLGSEAFRWTVDLQVLNGGEPIKFDPKKHIT